MRRIKPVQPIYPTKDSISKPKEGRSDTSKKKDANKEFREILQEAVIKGKEQKEMQQEGPITKQRTTEISLDEK